MLFVKATGLVARGDRTIRHEIHLGRLFVKASVAETGLVARGDRYTNDSTIRHWRSVDANVDFFT